MYCVEIADHPGSVNLKGRSTEYPKNPCTICPNNHLIQTVFDPKLLREEARSQPEQYMAIITENGAKGELDMSYWDRQIVSGGNNDHVRA